MAIALCASSCKKEGVYKPGKKIVQIQKVDADGNTAPYEDWNWDGDLLQGITYHWMTENGKPAAEPFTYDGRRLVASTYVVDSTTLNVEYIYMGKKLVQVKTSNDTTDVFTTSSTYDFEHDGKHITKVVEHAVMSYADLPDYSPLHMVLPANVCSQMLRDEQRDRKAILGTKLTLTITRTYILTWEGDNVVKIESQCSREENPVYTVVSNYTYDGHHNPHAGLFAYASIINQYGEEIVNANNILTLSEVENYADGFVQNYEEHYTYTYDDDDYPVISQCEDSSSSGTRTTRLKYTYAE